MARSDTNRRVRPAFTLLELMAALAIIGVIALLIVPRAQNHTEAGAVSACHAQKAMIEVQASLWRRINGSWPSTNLGTIGADPDYFPEGLPTCPVDGSAYTIDASTGQVIGHNH